VSVDECDRLHCYDTIGPCDSCPQQSVEFLSRRVRELERARDSQAQEIRRLRARGVVMLTVGEHTVYGTSVAVNAVRSLLPKATRENGEQA
jgi:hypothetical protein